MRCTNACVVAAVGLLVARGGAPVLACVDGLGRLDLTALRPPRRFVPLAVVDAAAPAADARRVARTAAAAADPNAGLVLSSTTVPLDVVPLATLARALQRSLVGNFADVAVDVAASPPDLTAFGWKG